MNKVEELHTKAAYDEAMKKIIARDGIDSMHFNTAHSAVTEDIAIKFKDWTELNEFWLEDDSEDVEYGWCSHKLKLYGIKSTKLLFNEFAKTL